MGAKWRRRAQGKTPTNNFSRCRSTFVAKAKSQIVFNYSLFRSVLTALAGTAFWIHRFRAEFPIGRESGKKTQPHWKSLEAMWGMMQRSPRDSHFSIVFVKDIWTWPGGLTPWHMGIWEGWLCDWLDDMDDENDQPGGTGAIQTCFSRGVWSTRRLLWSGYGWSRVKQSTLIRTEGCRAAFGGTGLLVGM